MEDSHEWQAGHQAEDRPEEGATDTPLLLGD